MIEQASSDEITFGQLFRYLKSIYHSFLIRLYRFFRFIRKNWFIFLILIIIGVAAGHFLDKPGRRYQKTTLIVQVNYNSVHLIYDAVGQLNDQLSNNHIGFLKQYGFYKQHHKLLEEIDIEPVVNINDILAHSLDSGKYIKSLLNYSDIPKDQLFTSEVFTPFYHDHRINMTIASDADTTLIPHLLNYLNNIPVLQKAKSIYKNNLKSKIREDQFSIAHIDSVIQNMGIRSATMPSETPPFVQGNPPGAQGLGMLLQAKERLMNKLTHREVNLLLYDEPVVLKNRPLLTTNTASSFNKSIWFPVILVCLFLLLALLRHLYWKAKALAEGQDA